MPSLQIDAQPTVLVVGDDPNHATELEHGLGDHGIFCERTGHDAVGVTAVAVAPDLVLLMGGAAGEHYEKVIATLRRALAERTPPIAVVTSTHDLATRLDAFRRGAVAVFSEDDEPGVLAGKLDQLIHELAGGKYVGPSVGESSLDELLAALSHDLRAELIRGTEAGSGPVRLVLGGGKPLAMALREFVMRVKRNVVDATQLPELPPEEPDSERSVDTLPAPRRSIDGMRLILADEDAGRADVVAAALRALGARVLVTDVKPSSARLQLLRALDPQALLAGDDQIPGPGLELLRTVRDDYRLRWASLMVLRWEEVWPDETKPPAIEPLLGTLAGLIEVERSAEQRGAAGLSFDLRLESVGPIRLLRALDASDKPIRVIVDNPRLRIEVELSAGRVESAKAQRADGGPELTGLDALSALSVLHAGEVSVEPRESESSSSPLGSLDELLARLEQQKPPVAPSLFPEALGTLLPPSAPAPVAPTAPTAPAEAAAPTAPAGEMALPASPAVPAGLATDAASPAAEESGARAAPPPLPTAVEEPLEVAGLGSGMFGPRTLALGPLRVPLWVAIASGVVAALAFVAVVVTLATHRPSAAGAPTARVASVTQTAPAASAPPVASSSAMTPKALLEQASAGDQAALARLMAIPADQRTAAQALALAQGQQAEVLNKVAKLMREVKLDPKLLEKRKIQRRLVAASRSPITGASTLRELAAIDTSDSADLLYKVWTGTPARTPMTQLAQSLVHSQAVARRASPALAVALALRAGGPCDAMKRTVKHAIKVGDRRSLVPLARMMMKRGCGAHKAHDCYPCLRGDDLLHQAMSVVKRRRPPL